VTDLKGVKHATAETVNELPDFEHFGKRFNPSPSITARRHEADRRRPTADGVAIYDGTLFIGRIVERGGRFIVFNADDQMIGMFADQRQALRAIPPIIGPPPRRRYASRKAGLK
jgi:hypothetical protein